MYLSLEVGYTNVLLNCALLTSIVLSTYLAHLPEDLGGRTRTTMWPSLCQMLICDLATLPKQPLFPLHSSTFRILPSSLKTANETICCHVWETNKNHIKGCKPFNLVCATTNKSCFLKWPWCPVSLF